MDVFHGNIAFGLSCIVGVSLLLLLVVFLFEPIQTHQLEEKATSGVVFQLVGTAIWVVHMHNRLILQTVQQSSIISCRDPPITITTNRLILACS